jgi:hypothetical protein
MFLINTDTLNKIKLKISSDGIIGDGTITQLSILSRNETPSYAIENGLTPVPVVSAPSGKPVADQVNKVVVNAPSVSQQIVQSVAEPVSQPVVDQVNTVVDKVNTVADKVNTVVVNASSVSQPVSTKTLLKELTNQVATKPTTSKARIVELPPENEPTPTVLKIKKTHQRRLMKKVLMYIAIALVIYLIYLLFNENKK